MVAASCCSIAFQEIIRDWESGGKMDRAKYRAILKVTLFQSTTDLRLVQMFAFQQRPEAHYQSYTGVLQIQEPECVSIGHSRLDLNPIEN